MKLRTPRWRTSWAVLWTGAIFLPAALLASPSPSAQFLADGSGFENFSDRPNGQGAAGPDHLVFVDDANFIVQSKTGSRLFALELGDFWAPALTSPGQRSFFSPRVFFDPTTRRWITTALAFTTPFVAFLPNYYHMVAISDTADPTGTWRKYAFNLNTVAGAPLRPEILNPTQTGFSSRWIAMTLVARNRGVPDGCHLYVYEKADLISGLIGPTTQVMLGRQADRSLAPMVPVSGAPHDDLYAMEAESIENPLTSIRYNLGKVTDFDGIIYMNNDLVHSSGFTFFGASVPFHRQLDGGAIESSRISEIASLVFDGTSLYSAQMVWPLPTSPVRLSLRWAKWSPAGNNLTLLDSGLLDDPTGQISYDYPSLSVTSAGDMLLGFTRFSSTTFPSAGYAFRAATDPPGTLQPPEIYKPGRFAFSPLRSGGNPWGPYSGTSLDPADGSLWTAQQYAEDLFNDGDVLHSAWGVQWARVSLGLAPPTIGTPVAASTDSIRWNWVDNAGNETGYRVRRSSDNAAISPGLAANTTFYLQTGLTPNQPQQVYAQAVNGSTTARSANTAVTYSLANPPSASTAVLTSPAAALFGWSANGNPAGTGYRVAFSTAGGPASFFDTTASSRAFAGLTPRTTYQFSVRAQNGNGIFTAAAGTVTVVTPPAGPNAPSGVAAVAFSTASVTWSWTDNSTGDGAEDGFRVRRSSDGVVIATRPADTNSFVHSLGINSPARIFVEAFNAAGSSASAISATAYSLANVPVASTATLLAADTGRFVWLGNGNPAGTVYEVSFRAANDDPDFFDTVDSSMTFASLAPTTTYFVSVRARNGDAVFTAPSATLSFVTPRAGPNAPSGLVAVAFTTGTILWNWTDNASGAGAEDGFRVRRASDSVDISGVLAANTQQFLQPGLGPNTPARVRVEAFNATGSSVSAPSATAYTAANPPAGLTAAGGAAAISAAWLANGNPAGTVYQTEVATATGPFSAACSAAALSCVLEDLQPSTLYRIRVRAQNSSGLATVFVATSAVTAPSAPGAPSNLRVVAKSTGSLTWRWDDNATNEDAVEVGTVDIESVFVSLSGPLPPNTVQWVQSGLGANALVGNLVVRVENATAEARSSPGPLAHTLARPPTNTALAFAAGTATLSWDDNGNPPATFYRAEISSNSAPFGEFYRGRPATAAQGPLGNGAYAFRVRAENGDGDLTAYDLTVATSVAGVATFDICDSSGNINLGAIEVSVPAGSVPCGTTFTIFTPETFPGGPGAAGALDPVGVGVDISAEPVVCGFSLTLGYNDGDVSGLDESTLLIARYDAVRGLWLPLPSRPDPGNNRVSTGQACTSLIQVMARAPSATVGTAKVYPLPARPSRGHTQVTISDLPAGAKVEIFTVSAERIRTLTAGPGGDAVWDLRNESGEPAASGTYLARVSKDGNDEIVKVLVQK